MSRPVIKCGSSLALSVTMPIEGEDITRKNYFFRIFLKEEGFKYKIRAHYLHVYYIVECDDLIDAAKVQTWLSKFNG